MSSSVPGIVAAILLVCIVPLAFGLGALGLSRRSLLEIAGAAWFSVAVPIVWFIVLPAMRTRGRTPSDAHTPGEGVKR
jgi:hypothetical protein